MTLPVLGIVLCAAFLHAFWNALVKASADRTVTLGLVALGHCAPALLLIPFVPIPNPEAFAFIIASTVIHWGYYYFLNISYRFADLSLAYPIARGMAPVMVALGAMIWADEYLSPLAWTGIFVVSAGIMILAAIRHADKRGIGAALLTSAIIAAYSIVDGIGIRASGTPLGYVVWLFAAEICVAAFVLTTRISRFRMTALKPKLIGFSGGVISGIAYALALYAKTLAPIGIVSAIRETSVIFAALIGVIWMGEGPATRRLIAATVVALGVVILALT
ncbi:DMT family transporter [Marivita hallyeonensis]|uniref:EamA-like transporter family protein n=1 Tax=Marivita hallyeonensis TaxID=996342 RepID=A0A1M5U2S1_9RHOB|nr:DMT family transporter [Marivita hallyeonensis]SHH57160.1 EamA-like transporter family protein [Marivita hallyeonensis]